MIFILFILLRSENYESDDIKYGEGTLAPAAVYPSLYFGNLVVPACSLLVTARNSMLGLFFSPFGLVLLLARSSFGRKPDSRQPAPRGG